MRLAFRYSTDSMCPYIYIYIALFMYHKGIYVYIRAQNDREPIHSSHSVTPLEMLEVEQLINSNQTN